MEIVRISLKKRIDNSYPIYIGFNIAKFICSDLKKKSIGNKYLVISDSTTGKLFGPKLVSYMRKIGLKTDILLFPEGEKNKNLKTYSGLMESACKFGLDRKSAIIALGGGVAGDMAGFVAATYMRGINYVQVPTSLLAMVDSSIGGKVGVDLKCLKNAAGSFYQPKAVYIDIKFLESLPKKQMGCGLAEVIKYAVVADKNLFSFIEKNIEKLIKKDKDALAKVIKGDCKIKCSIVEKDELERDLRVVANYGHTIGHAIEAITNYREFNHGEAVAIGMNVAAHISNEMGFMPSSEVERQKKLLVKSGLPCLFPRNLNPAAVIGELHKDKKSFGEDIVFTLPERIGKTLRLKGTYRIKVPKSTIRKAIEECK
ncbi:MAG TPA: 3-dehydroquinate synthase [Candidatus Nanoarchaeia archaeon]|nr:3-dehydroquinate synthase [Candidatus Nanoarchaeia archaeon]